MCADSSDGTASTAAPWAVFWIASVAVFLVGMDTTMLFAAFGAIQSSFSGTTAAELSWVLNGYTVVYACMLIPAGGLADAYGRKRVFMLGVVLFLVASAACGLAGSVAWLVAARVLQAFGAALLTPASLSLVLVAFPRERRAVAVGLWGAVGGLSAAIGPSLGSFVIDTVGWPWAFYLNLPLGSVALWYGASRLPQDRRPSNAPALDVPGIALLIVAVSAIALSIVESGSSDWSRTELGTAAAIGLALLVGFVVRARSARSPLVDLALFANPTYLFVNVATLTFGVLFSMMFLGYFFFLTGVWHYTLTRAGTAVTPGPLLVIPAAIVAGKVATRIGHRPVLVFGSLIHAAGSLWFLSAPGAEPAYAAQWLPGLVLSGIGVGMVLPSLSAAAVNRLPPQQYAVGSAVNQAIRQMGSVLGVAIIVVLVGHINPTLADFALAYKAQVALAVLTALLCLPVKTRPPDVTQ